VSSSPQAAAQRPAASASGQPVGADAGELTRAVELAIVTPEIAAALVRYGIADVTLSDRLYDEGPALLHEALPGFQEAHAAQDALERAKALANRSKGAIGVGLIQLVFGTTLAITAVVVQSLVAAVVGDRSLPKILAEDTSTAAAVGMLIGLVALWIGSTLLSSRRDERVAARVGVRAREAEAEDASTAARAQLLEGVVLPRARELIEGLADAPFSRRLGFVRAPGLSQVFSSEYEVPTAAMAELGASMAAMSGGSIGLAGPRGAGKSVLLRSFAAGRQPLENRAKTIGVVVDAPVRYNTREFVLHLFERVCREAGGEDDDNHAVPRTLARALLEHRWLRRPIASPGGSTPVQRLAGDHLDIIVFERTFTVGGGVALDARFAKLTGDVKSQLARVPWSLPQLITTFRGFLEILAREHVVVIGIDELDKLESGEDARSFVNDIKGVFGVSNCFFLVSISEDAMSSFERRGQPVRDVFDSAFDHVVRVPPLTHAECERVLRRRVIGMGAPFAAACTTMSGGVPRDVIRFARRLMLTAAAQDDDELSTLLPEVLAAETGAKARAGLIVAARHSDIGASADIVRWLRELEAGAPAPAACDQYFTHVRPRLEPDQRDDDAATAGRRELRALAAETSAWLYHVDTVAQLFSEHYDEARHRELTADGTIDRLAAARHDLTLGADASWSATSCVRERAGIPARPWPCDS